MQNSEDGRCHEDGEEFHEVLTSKGLLSLGSQPKQSRVVGQNLGLDHPANKFVDRFFGQLAKAINAFDPLEPV